MILSILCHTILLTPQSTPLPPHHWPLSHLSNMQPRDARLLFKDLQQSHISVMVKLFRPAGGTHGRHSASPGHISISPNHRQFLVLPYCLERSFACCLPACKDVTLVVKLNATSSQAIPVQSGHSQRLGLLCNPTLRDSGITT